MTNNTVDSVVKKIQKLFSLAGNNPNQAEADAAMLKAQKLIAQYNIDMAEHGEQAETISLVNDYYVIKTPMSFKVFLGNIVADGFGCRMAVSHSKFGKQPIFFGQEHAVQAALEAYKFATTLCHRNAQKQERTYRKNNGTACGVYNSYAQGFCLGIKAHFDEACRALSIVVPDAVNEYFAENTNNKTTNLRQQIGYHTDIRQQGIRDGKYSLNKNQLEV